MPLSHSVGPHPSVLCWLFVVPVASLLYVHPLRGFNCWVGSYQVGRNQGSYHLSVFAYDICFDPREGLNDVQTIG